MSKIACIGDSVVLGRIDPVNQGWASLLRAWHVKKNPSSNMVYNLGIGGNTSRDVLKRITFECETRKLDAIIIGFGLNDMRRLQTPKGEFLVPPKEFAENTRAIFNKAREITPNIAFAQMPRIREELLQPHKDNYWFEKDWEAYSRSMKDLCEECNVNLINHIVPVNLSGDQISTDGLHPTTEVHKCIFEAARIWVEGAAVMRH